MAQRRRYEIPGVDADTPAAEAATLTLLVKSRPVFELERAAASGTDVDAVHDMRVASRRLRETLSVFRLVLDPDTFAKQRKLVKRVTRALGDVRDADVFCVLLGKTAEDASDDIERLALTYLIDRKGRERASAVAKLQKRFGKLDLESSRAGFEGGARNTRECAEATMPLADLARTTLADRIDRAYDHLPAALQRDALSEQHAMRIACKHLRYAVEIHAPCFDPSFDEVHDTIVAFQDVLGDMHDIDVITRYTRSVVALGDHEMAGVSAEAMEAVLADLGQEWSGLFEKFRRLAANNPEPVMRERILDALG